MKAFIIFRDRVTYARRCTAALQAAGLDVHIIDHASTWPAAITWLTEAEQTGITVMRRGENAYPWDVWRWRPFEEAVWDAGPYIVTDPDVIPSDDCPPDWPARLTALLARHTVVKAGLGLRLDRIPDHPGRQAITDHQRTWFWGRQAEPGAFHANTDTTLAAYRPWDQYPLFALGPALRTGPPYLADHLAWYETGQLPPELNWYYQHSSDHHDVTRTLRP